jgi:glycerol-1-phosphate dehydrogenase [NAD(P)+]
MLTPIHSTNDFLSRDSAALASTSFACPECGRIHNIPIQAMSVGRNQLALVTAHAARVLGHAPRVIGVIYDRAIEGLIDTHVLTPLASQGQRISLLPVGAPNLLLDSDVVTGNDLSSRIDPRIEILLGAGSGVICDLTKWAATRSKLPYILYATAPSMNAYASITATMTEGDIKTSRLLDPAAAVLMDIDLQAAAPMEMIQAGIGDLAARAVCNADWKLAGFLNQSYFCPVPYRMTASNEEKYMANCAAISDRRPDALAHLSEAVLMSGLSMTVLDGETSPSSGAEHVISHFWDLLTHTRGLPKNLHGTQVGVGTIIMLAFFEIMHAIDITRVNPLRILRTRPSIEAMEAENNHLYGSAGYLFNQVVKKKRVSDQDFPAYIRSIQTRWEMLWNEVDPYLATLKSIRGPLLAAGLPLTLASVQRTRAEAQEALIKGPQYRARFTLLDLAADLGFLPEIAGEVLDKAQVGP